MINRSELIRHLKLLICKGSVNLIDQSLGAYRTLPPTNEEAEYAIQYLRLGAAEAPEVVLGLCFDVFNNGMDPTHMAMLALAACISLCPDPLFKTYYKLFLEVISFLTAKELRYLTNLLKSRSFGTGLGSRAQKLLRAYMESWSPEGVAFNIEFYVQDFYTLLRLLHPRYKDVRGQMVRKILN